MSEDRFDTFAGGEQQGADTLAGGEQRGSDMLVPIQAGDDSDRDEERSEHVVRAQLGKRA